VPPPATKTYTEWDEEEEAVLPGGSSISVMALEKAIDQQVAGIQAVMKYHHPR